MRIFVTGGSGYVGRSTIRALVREGNEVTALARNDRASQTVSDVGAIPVRGELTDTALLREAAKYVDGVIHLAASEEKPDEVDLAAAEALLDGAHGSPYVHTGGVWVYGDTNGVVDEDARRNPPRLRAWRLANEERVLARAETGGHPVLVMPGLVYGESGGLLERFFVEPGRATGAVPCIGDGSNHWALVHRDDIVALYVLALRAPAGSVYAGVSDQHPTQQEVTEALSHAAGCPGSTVTLSLDEALAQMGPIAEAFALDQRFTGARAREQLGWKPAHQDALADLARGR
ncbi:NAD-dependent epimerase/dehydratase family protein [Actinopolymorpha pittospori]|uniref:Nucleoside-diphosphate-sugar epimerase n=1 Tax=Actinopolymorpha pittospori TaxID=648752 RepID=A0A927MTJ8_9ACTN|nr:NAD-dependent epimerase/dehydratase family protein [Actinopolymorpha pittospori]MBE1606651.1 nucleoside-diphosphate-sugar epimerase [Actinopolymorpha pittospori]